MATQKPISTISYNTEAFLHEKLETWLNAHIIQAYMYICHKGEDGDKDHIHVRIEPNKKLDPMDLAEELREFQIGKDKPLGVRPFRPSKEEDWILYAVHDSQYLKLKYHGGDKGEKLPYDWQNIVVPENYDMEIAYHRAKAYLKHTSVNIASRLRNGESPITIIEDGENVFLVNALNRALYENDYQKLQADYDNVYRQFNELIAAVEKCGYSLVIDEDGHVGIDSCDNNGS